MKRKEIREKSSEFLRTIVEKLKQKEEPATPSYGEKDVEKIEKITKELKKKKAKKYF